MQMNPYNAIWLCLISFYCITPTYTQTAHKNLRNGDMLYGYGKFGDAETEYRKADTETPSVKSAYNLGNTLIDQERYEEAAKRYQDAAARATTDAEKSKIYHNQGNAYFKKEKYKESVESYKNALKYDAKDQETKQNLAMAQYELKKQIQQQKQEQQQNKDQNKEDKKQDQDKQQKQDQDNKNEDKQDQEQQNQQNQNQDEQDNKSSEQQGQDDKNLSKSDAEKLLEIMDNEEKKVQQKLRRMDTKGKKPKKDW